MFDVIGTYEGLIYNREEVEEEEIAESDDPALAQVDSSGIFIKRKCKLAISYFTSVGVSPLQICKVARNIDIVGCL